MYLGNSLACERVVAAQHQEKTKKIKGIGSTHYTNTEQDTQLKTLNTETTHIRVSTVTDDVVNISNIYSMFLQHPFFLVFLFYIYI